jgi:PmbA protein
LISKTAAPVVISNAQNAGSSPASAQNPPNLQELAQFALERAKAAGASAAEIEISTSVGQSVSVRLKEVETIEYNRDKGMAITVYVGQQKGAASTSDLSRDAIIRTVEAACTIAKYTEADEFSGLADPVRLFKGVLPDLGLNQPWVLSVDEAIKIAVECEAAAYAVDKRINNSEGASVSTHTSDFVYANSNGFMNGYPTSRASLSVAVIASDANGMQRDYWYTSARGQVGLESAAHVGKIAGQRTVARLGAKRIATCDAPVLFDNTASGSLIGSFVGAVSGSSLYRKASFLQDSVGQQVFSPLVQIREEPHLMGASSSSPFDGEGVATAPRDVVRDGVVQGYFLGSYSARKLGLQSTGNAGGNHNLQVKSGELDFAGLVKKMGRGLIVSELMGQGVNMVTGDYSRGIAGFWVEGGEIVHPVEELTIAGNMKDMYKNIVDIGTDVNKTGSKHIGSVLIDRMSLAG